jgi:hypothetical protein
MFIKTTIIFFAAYLLLYSQEITDTTIIVGDSLFISDTLAVNDTLVVKDSVFVYDTSIVFPAKLYENSFEIERKNFLRNDYRYAGNLIEPFQFNFIRNLGTPGQVNETFIYGVGFDGISYLQDGILINDRRLNSLDLNLVQSEDIETIEILPSPRGFLYGPMNNPVTVNFITRDFIPPQPYSRIKYYQGPYGEAMVDGSFNALVSKSFQFSFDVTNRKYDSSYTNTAFSTWQAKVKANYFFNNNFHLTASYNYVTKTTGLWGGVDTDSIFRMSVPLNDLLYDPDFAPVNNPLLKQDDLLHSSSLRLTSVQSENSRTEFTLYQQFKESKISLTELDISTLGVNLNQNFGLNPVRLYAALTYERNKLENWNRDNSLILLENYSKRNQNFFALAGSISLDLIKNVTPTVFYKFSGVSYEFNDTRIYDESLIGYGADITYRPGNSFAFYAGYSEYEKVINNERRTKNFETGITYKYENQFADLRYFNRSNSDILLFLSGEDQLIIGNLSGIGLSANINYWYLQFETQGSAYFANEEKLYGVPDFRIIGGLYFRGKLFEDNLDLKTGLKITYSGELNSITVQYGRLIVEPSYKLDFILSGEIRKAAIIYFTIENILDKQYFITPYYPMPGIALRFGLAWEFLN